MGTQKVSVYSADIRRMGGRIADTCDRDGRGPGEGREMMDGPLDVPLAMSAGKRTTWAIVMASAR